ncbi:MAG: nuclear transport factor 2 family protein [Actinomycetota bacterium]|nr:nuclear transport factor 2 family protein [Actinomycetota bacterium]
MRRGVASVDAFWEMLDEYVIWDLRAWPMPDLDPVYVGREAVIKASRHYWGTWDDYRVEAEEILDAGPSIVVIIYERGRGKGSGAPVEQRHPQVWTFRAGRIIRWESFQSRAEALEAAGLSE